MIATHCTYSCPCGAGRDSIGAGGWTLTPTPPVWTQTPTEDASCFADPENFDCSCHAKKQRQCGYVPQSPQAYMHAHPINCHAEKTCTFAKNFSGPTKARLFRASTSSSARTPKRASGTRNAALCMYGWHVYECVQTKKYMQLNQTQHMQHDAHNACAHTYTGTRTSTVRRSCRCSRS